MKLAPFAAQEFDATILCYLAAVAAGSTDGQKMADELIDITAPGGTEYSWQQLPDAIKALEDGKDIDYTGASGPIDMDVHGNPTNGVFDIYQYTSGELEARRRGPGREAESGHALADQPHLQRRREQDAGPVRQGEDARHVGAGLGIGRDAAAGGDRPGAGVVGSQRQRDGVKLPQQVRHQMGLRIDRGDRVERIAQSVRARGRRA